MTHPTSTEPAAPPSDETRPSETRPSETRPSETRPNAARRAEFQPGIPKPGWGWRLFGLLILLLPGGLGFYGLVLWLGGGGETHGLNVGKLVFIVVGLPSYLFGGLMYYSGWRMKHQPEPE